jgi:hypothetical protein
MSDHVTQWLGAYLDGELRGALLRQVSNHLENCDHCQAELDEMRGLSALLHEATPVGEFLPAERFVANLNLNLPRQTEATQTRKVVEIGWWLIPAGVIVTWVFVQVTFQLSALLMTVSNVGLFGDSLAWLSLSGTRQTAWFGLLLNTFGNSAETLALINSIDLFIQDLTRHFFWQAALGLVYLAWLVRWWLGQQNQTTTAGNFSRS